MTSEEKIIQSRRRFHTFLAVFVLFLLLAGSFGLFYLWQFLASYESGMPIHAAQAAAEKIRNREDAWIRQYAGFVPSLFTDEEDSVAYLDKNWKDMQEAELKKCKVNQDTAIYSLKAGKKVLADIVLKRSEEKDFFGTQIWEIDHLEKVFTVQEPYTIYAPAFAEVYVNGIRLTAQQRNTRKKEMGMYRTLPEEFTVPEYISYTVTDLLDVPEITVKTSGNSSYAVEKDGNDHLISVLLSEEEAVPFRQLATDAAKSYAKFITADAGRGEVLSYSITGSAFYRRISEFYNGWYIDHDSHSFENVKTEHFVKYSPEHVSCTISFLYVIQKGAKRFEYPSSYEVYMIHTKDGWRVAEMVIQ